MIKAPIITFTGAFGREALLLYKTENLSSSILGKISSANIFAHELSSAFFSRAVSENTLSLKDICWLLFTLNDINLTTLQIYNHYNTIDLGVVRLAANYSIFRNFLYFWPRYHEIGVLCYYNYNCGSYWTEEWFNKYLVNILHLSLYDTGADCGVRQPDICQRSCLP